MTGELSQATPEEKKVIQEINQRVKTLNKNNVTRTKAYLDFYRKHPEIEWALLGHLVSRNGGWNMTDLKGEFLSKLLSEKEQQHYFTFLERGNWLIFHDAYPQFLVYQESLRRQKPLFHLLSFFGVSTFMETVWNQFWIYGNRYLLAIALIINEQSYLEKRVIHDKHFQKTVLHTIEFKLQDILRLNHVLFPYQTDPPSQQIKLVGQTLHHFDSLDERIKLGKRLYALLFMDQNLLHSIKEWAYATNHTGSRKDFWPQLFNDVKETLPGTLYKPQVNQCKLTGNSSRIYSPQLQAVWENVDHRPAEEGDWFDDWEITDYFENPYQNIDGAIKHDYCETIERLELAVFTKKAIFHWKQ